MNDLLFDLIDLVVESITPPSLSDSHPTGDEELLFAATEPAEVDELKEERGPWAKHLTAIGLDL